MEHVMMMEIHIDVNVQIILWVIDVKEVFKIMIFILFYTKNLFLNISLVEKSCSSPQCFNGGVCVNTAISFKCICPIDYEGQRCDLSKIFFVS
jgi:hypothetical protein